MLNLVNINNESHIAIRRQLYVFELQSLKVKGIVHPNMNIFCYFTHAQVIQYVGDCSWAKKIFSWNNAWFIKCKSADARFWE